jgi:NAD(P)-dependent dehydrogenase (short-subunit alcohol dehydrogenase family)
MTGGSRGTALVTGGARRIGRALCLAAARSGYDVAIHVRDADADANDLSRDIKELGRNAAAIVTGDLGEPFVGRILGAATQALGPVTLLVNNASRFEVDSLEDLSVGGYDAHMATNLKAPVFLMQAFAKALPKDAQGLIVNIVDQRVMRPNPLFYSYALSKAALWAATQTAAQALAPRIRVNAIGPGPTLASTHQSAADFAAEAAAVPLQKAASPDDIAAALTYLIDASSVTGQMLLVDGGQHLSWKTPDVMGSL